MTMPMLQDWEDEFRRSDTCPWAGPRPLLEGPEDRKRFLGRESDTRHFANLVAANSLVFLAGESGVGKSSLLNVKLIDQLKKHGRTPFVCSDWTMTGHKGDDIDDIIRSKMCSGLSPVPCDTPGAARFCNELDHKYAGAAVLIFDQFEELIRHQPALFEEVAAWILDANKRNRTHIVLSLRLEYLHRLRRIEREANPFSMAIHTLEPIADPATIEKIVRSNAAGTEQYITRKAAARLIKDWNAGSQRSSSDWNDIGLLHLQGTLYALHALAAEEGKGRIDHFVVDELVDVGRRGPIDGTDSRRSTLFHVGLREAVRYKIKRCRAACTTVGLDQVFVEGTRSVVRRLVPHLSSGGYKLEREEWGLAQVALSRELDRLSVAEGHSAGRPGPTTSDAEKIFRDLVGRSHTCDGASGTRASGTRVSAPKGPDLLRVSRAELVAANPELRTVCPPPGAVSEKEGANGVDSPPWTADPHDLSAGPLLGLRPVEVLIEELRRAAFAVKWLKTAGLVRAGAAAHDVTMLSLVHDGIAAALEQLRRVSEPGPKDALFLLSAARGETFHWRHPKDPRQPCEEFDGSKKPVIFTNLRWRDCQVSAVLHRVTFVNCDFRGTRFRECTFCGVVFVNCLLDDVSFEECKILGMTSEAERTIQRAESSRKTLVIDNVRLPSFRVEVGPDVVSGLRRYRAFEGAGAAGGHAGSWLYSRTSGLPAVPWQKRFGRVLPWRLERGGLAMYGGRLSSLMVRRCTFDKDGRLAFRHIAGSALDVVEQAVGGRIDISSSSIRGFTVTRSVDDRAPNARERHLAIRVFDSVMTNVWFGKMLNGKAEFDNCLVWQLCNMSAQRQFQVAVKNSRYHGLVNPSHVDGTLLPGDEVSFPEQDRRQLAEEFMPMDYRSKPARLELES